jgi:hypothetical protein
MHATHVRARNARLSFPKTHRTPNRRPPGVQSTDAILSIASRNWRRETARVIAERTRGVTPPESVQTRHGRSLPRRVGSELLSHARRHARIAAAASIWDLLKGSRRAALPAASR